MRIDVAVEREKCKAEAARLIRESLSPEFVRNIYLTAFEERIATALLEARADALRNSSIPYGPQHGTPANYAAAEEIMRQVRARRARWL